MLPKAYCEELLVMDFYLRPFFKTRYVFVNSMLCPGVKLKKAYFSEILEQTSVGHLFLVVMRREQEGISGTVFFH